MRLDPSLLTGQPAKLFALIRPFHWQLGLVGIPGVAIVLLAGRLITDPLHAAIAAGAAFRWGSAYLATSSDSGGARWSPP